MQEKIVVAAAFTVLAIVLSAAGLLILLARGYSKNWRNWRKVTKHDVTTTAYISALIAVLLIAYVTAYFLIIRT